MASGSPPSKKKHSHSLVREQEEADDNKEAEEDEDEEGVRDESHLELSAGRLSRDWQDSSMSSVIL